MQVSRKRCVYRSTRGRPPVNWNDAVAFCRRLSNQEGDQYRLPTEAEWEYACRAGTTTAYCFGNKASLMGEYAQYWSVKLTRRQISFRPVGESTNPNAWGLYDMHGNASEWCQDWYGPYENLKVASDPTGVASGEERVLRGGTAFAGGVAVRAAHRIGTHPDHRIRDVGFRVARTIPLSP